MKGKGKVKKAIAAQKRKMVIAALLLLTLSIGGFMGYAINKKRSAEICAKNMAIASGSQEAITYKIFTSPHADFSFQYPSSWNYEENRDPNNPDLYRWVFYKSAEQSDEDIVLEAGYLTEAVNLFSKSNEKSRLSEAKASYWVRTYPSNDPDTFITQENIDSQDTHRGYIYWQKGRYFTNADDVTDYSSGNIHIISYEMKSSAQEMSTRDLKTGYEIAQHIAKSLKID